MLVKCLANLSSFMGKDTIVSNCSAWVGNGYRNLSNLPAAEVSSDSVDALLPSTGELSGSADDGQEAQPSSGNGCKEEVVVLSQVDFCFVDMPYISETEMLLRQSESPSYQCGVAHDMILPTLDMNSLGDLNAAADLLETFSSSQEHQLIRNSRVCSLPRGTFWEILKEKWCEVLQDSKGLVQGDLLVFWEGQSGSKARKFATVQRIETVVLEEGYSMSRLPEHFLSKRRRSGDNSFDFRFCGIFPRNRTCCVVYLSSDDNAPSTIQKALKTLGVITFKECKFDERRLQIAKRIAQLGRQEQEVREAVDNDAGKKQLVSCSVTYGCLKTGGHRNRCDTVSYPSVASLTGGLAPLPGRCARTDTCDKPTGHLGDCRWISPAYFPLKRALSDSPLVVTSRKRS